MTKYITLDRIVKSALLDRGLSVHWYFKYMKFATECLREMRFDTLGVIETSVITVPGTQEIQLPDNVIKIKDVTDEKDECLCDGWIFDCDTRILSLNVTPGTQVKIKVITDGTRANSATEVDSRAQRAIERYIIWQNSQGRDNRGSAEGRHFFREYEILRARRSDLEAKDFYIR
ncbi:hypothetical protein GCM10027051_31310 [Niabella terrae]